MFLMRISGVEDEIVSVEKVKNKKTNKKIEENK